MSPTANSTETWDVKAHQTSRTSILQTSRSDASHPAPPTTPVPPQLGFAARGRAWELRWVLADISVSGLPSACSCKGGWPQGRRVQPQPGRPPAPTPSPGFSICIPGCCLTRWPKATNKLV